MDDWKTIALEMRKKKASSERIAKRVGKTEVEIQDFFRKEKIEKLMTEGRTKQYKAFENLNPSKHVRDWDGNQTVVFGLIGDTHFNSKYVQITYLNEFYEKCGKRGIKDIYHTGDIDEGEQMRIGHQYECYTQGADEHVREIVQKYPSFDGITTHFITGNHDSSIYKRCGVDIGKMLSIRRADLNYLGRDSAKIKITPNCILELRHPWTGGAYALSYRIQKMIESMDPDSKPNILAVGHHHKVEYLFYRNVHAFQTGCFQSQTPFTRGLGISAHLGGWIVTVEVDKYGHVQSIIPQLIPFYKGIDDDYLRYV